jgi:putative lipoic acid-binding regulatory protein
LTEQVSIDLLEKTHVFPCPYTFKLIGREEQGFVARAVSEVRQALHADRDPPYTVRSTADGKHVAVSLEPVVYSAQQVLDVYDRVRDLSGLRFIL